MKIHDETILKKMNCISMVGIWSSRNWHQLQLVVFTCILYYYLLAVTITSISYIFSHCYLIPTCIHPFHALEAYYRIKLCLLVSNRKKTKSKPLDI